MFKLSSSNNNYIKKLIRIYLIKITIIKYLKHIILQKSKCNINLIFEYSKKLKNGALF